MRFERIATDGGAILYDPTRTGNAAGLFDLAVWRERGQVTEITGGRGSVFFLDDAAQQLVLRRYRRGGLVARISLDRYLWLGETRNRAFLSALAEADSALARLRLDFPWRSIVQRWSAGRPVEVSYLAALS